MLTALRTHVRAYLGVDAIPRLESQVAKVIDILNGLVRQQNDASAAQASSFHNLQAAIDKLQTAVRDGDASPEVQAAADQLTSGFASLQKAADDADTGFESSGVAPTDPNAPAEPGSDVPADTEPTAPPVEGGNTTR